MTPFLLNRQDQICAIWAQGFLVIGNRVKKLEGMMGRWKSIFELKSRRNRYLIAGYTECDYKSATIIKLIGGRAQVISSLQFLKTSAHLMEPRLLGSSTLILVFPNSLSVVTVSNNSLTLISENVDVLQGNSFSDGDMFSLIASSNSQKKLLIARGGKFASIKLNYH